MSKSTAKRLERLEDICIGAGFLLQKMLYQYGDDFGVGTDAQVRDCIRNIQQVAAAKKQREAAAAATGTQP